MHSKLFVDEEATLSGPVERSGASLVLDVGCWDELTLCCWGWPGEDTALWTAIACWILANASAWIFERDLDGLARVWILGSGNVGFTSGMEDCCC